MNTERKGIGLLVLLGVFVAGACAPAPSASPLASIAVGASPTVGRGDSEANPPPFVLPQPSWQVACQGIDAEQCRQMAEGAAGSRQPNDPPLHTILVRCTTLCTAAEGNGETILIFADGTSRTAGSWGYSAPMVPGAPRPPPARPAGDWQLVCQGVPRATCEEFAADSYEAVNEVGLELETLTVACTSPSCTSTAGRGETVATFFDGTVQSVASWEYLGAEAP